jgi:heat shock protein HtpX
MTAYASIASNKRRSALFIGVFILLVLGIGFVWDQMEGGGTLALPFAGVFALGSALTGYFAGDKMALAANQAIPVKKEESPELHRLVENLAITAGLPMPRLYLIPSPAINAFATGRDPHHASIAVTAGALEKLDRTELEGVLAHELSHVQNYDIRLMTVVAIFVGTIILLSDWFFRSRLWGGRGRDRDRNLQPAIAIGGLILLILSPIFAQLIQLAISRRREYLADASGVLLTRYAEGLARALEKIRAENIPVASANSATAHLYFSNPLSTNMGRSLFATHPPIEDRIAALRKM